jgi:hypothetical protein
MIASGWGAFPAALKRVSDKPSDDSTRGSVWTCTAAETRAEAVHELGATVYTPDGMPLSTSVFSRFGASSSLVSSLSHYNLLSGTSQSSKSTSSTPPKNTGSFLFLLPSEVSSPFLPVVHSNITVVDCAQTRSCLCRRCNSCICRCNVGGRPGRRLRIRL